MIRVLLSSLLLMTAGAVSAANTPNTANTQAPGPHEKLSAFLHAQAATASKAHASQTHSAPMHSPQVAATATRLPPSGAQTSAQLVAPASSLPRAALVPTMPTNRAAHTPPATLGGPAPQASPSRLDGTTLHARRPF